MDEAAAIYEALATLKIPGDFQAMAESERAASAEAKAGAQEAFRAAASALRQIRVTGDARDRLERAAARFDSLGGVEPEPEVTEPETSEEEWVEESDPMSEEPAAEESPDADPASEDPNAEEPG